MSELRDQMRRDAEALRSTRRGGEAGMDRVEAFERLFRQLPQLVDDLERAEVATERARADLLAMTERCILQAGHARQRGDAQREREWVVVAENARKIRAALGRPPAEKEEDPERCGHIRVQWDGPYRMPERCTAPAGRCDRRGAHGPWEWADQ